MTWQFASIHYDDRKIRQMPGDQCPEGGYPKPRKISENQLKPGERTKVWHMRK